MKLPLLLLGLLLPMLVWAQPQGPDLLWTRSLPSDSFRVQCKAFLRACDGQTLLMAYQARSQTYPDQRIFMQFKSLDEDGNVLWDRPLDIWIDTREFDPSFIEITGNGYRVVGWSPSYPWSEGIWNIWLDADGNVIHSHLGRSDSSFAVCISKPGAIVHVNVTYVGLSVRHDLWKEDSLGNTIARSSEWYGGEESELFSTKDDGCLIIQQTDNSDDGTRFRWYNASGLAEWTYIWNRGWNSNGPYHHGDMIPLSNGEWVFTGLMRSPGYTRTIHLTKLTGTGQAEWVREFSSIQIRNVKSVLAMSDGGYALLGQSRDTTGNPNADTDIWLARTDTSGNLLWDAVYGTDQNDSATGFVECSDGSFLIAATTGSWVSGFAPCLFRTARDPALPIEQESASLPYQLTLQSAYPNPFNATTTLSFGLPQSAKVRLSVFDLLGREVAVLMDGVEVAGSHRVSFDGADLASGIYFARLAAGERVQTRKLVVLK